MQYSHKDIAHLNHRLKEMISAGLQIPVSKEHQSVAKPMSPMEWERFQAEKAWATCGWVQDGFVKPDGTLCLQVEVPDEEDARRVAVIRYVSPEIVRDFMDGNGKVWPGLSITHLAVTPRPVQHRQTPFERIQLSLSHPRRVRLSLGADMPDEYDDYEDDMGAEDESGMDDMDMADDDVTDDEPMDDPVMDEPAGESKVAELVNLMREVFNIDVAGHVTSEKDLIDHLYTAALTAKAHKGMGEGIEGSDEFMDEPMDEGDVEEVPSSVMMSLRQENKALMARVLGDERKNVKARIDRLLKAGVIGKRMHQSLTQEASEVRLSLDANGGLKTNPFLRTLEMFEQNDAPKNRTARLGMGNYKAGAQEVPKPGTDKTDRSLDKGVMTKLTKGQYKAKDEGDKK